MLARDPFHHIVCQVLQKDGWCITHDPYTLAAEGFDLAIDLGAEKVLAAELEGTKIAVEIKSFLGPSKITEFYGALGQFIAYRTALKQEEPDRTLYLAAPENLYDNFFATPFVQNLITQNKVYLLTYDTSQEALIQWIPLPSTVSTFENS